MKTRWRCMPIDFIFLYFNFSSKLFSPPDKSNIVTVILWFKCVKVLVQWCYWDNGNHFSATGGDILKNKMALTVLMTRVDAGRRPSVTYNEGFWVAATGFIWRMSVLSCGLVLLLIFRVSLWLCRGGVNRGGWLRGSEVVSDSV